MPSQSLLQLRAVILHPTPNCGVVDVETTLLQQLLNLAQRERIAKIPPDGTKDDARSVCRHLKIAGRVTISRFFHVITQLPEKLQHIPLPRYGHAEVAHVLKNCHRSALANLREFARTQERVGKPICVER